MLIHALSISGSLSKYSQVPFFIAAPTTTLDPLMADGSQIIIEQRPPEEITHFKGQRTVKEGVKVGSRRGQGGVKEGVKEGFMVRRSLALGGLCRPRVTKL